MKKVYQLFSRFTDWMDSLGRLSWIGLMVIAFFWNWLLGVIVLFFLLWTKRLGSDIDFKEKAQGLVNQEKLDEIKRGASHKFRVEKKKFEGFFSKGRQREDNT